MANLARIVLRISNLRFPGIGSIYTSTSLSQCTTTIPIPNKEERNNKHSTVSYSLGPLISWPFFGSSRGLLRTLDRGPWRYTESYLESCARREINDVIRENEGRMMGKKPMRMPSTGNSDEAADNTGGIEAGSESYQYPPSDGPSSPSSTISSLEFDDPADTFYRDYRAAQRFDFLVAHTNTREVNVRNEMGMALNYFGRLLDEWAKSNTEMGTKAFGLDLHDLSRENVFVDEKDHSKVVSFKMWIIIPALNRTEDMHHRLGVRHHSTALADSSSSEFLASPPSPSWSTFSHSHSSAFAS
jgi:hypothetical protein